MMRMTLTFLPVLFFNILLAQGTWEVKDFPNNSNLNTIFFTDSITGWVAGDSGVIMHTSDGGNSWISQSVNNNDITDIFFLDKDKGWATSLKYQEPPFGTVLLSTTNGGVTWDETLYPEENIFMSCVLFLDSLKGWMGGSPHAIVRTTDGGITWHQAAIDTSILAFFPVETIKFYNYDYGYATGGIFDVAGVIWRTNNGGDLWYAIDVADAPADEVHGLHLFDSVNVIGAGGDPDFGYGVGMIRTSDGGVSWQYEELLMQGNALDIDFRNSFEAWAPLGSRRKLIYSMDSGTSWTEISSPDSLVIIKMTFTDPMHGYATGREGAFLKYRPPLLGTTDLLTEELKVSNHPNPFKDKTTISIDLGNTSGKEIKIVVTDIAGKRIDVLYPQKSNDNKYKVEFIPSSLSSGVLIYYVMADDVILYPARKMIINF